MATATATATATDHDQDQELQAEERSCPWHRVTQEALATDFHSHDFDPRFVSPDGLSVGLAWTLATQWADRLRGVVRLGSDRTNEQFCVAPNYEWIDVRVGCCAGSASQGSHAGGPNDAAERPDVASAIRAAVLVWRALSCCRGFSAQEHPVFWRCVFDTVTVRSPDAAAAAANGASTCCRDLRDSTAGVVSDVYRFFDGVSFPRLRLIACQDRAVGMRLEHDLRVLCGRDAPDAGVKAAMESALQTLARFACQGRLSTQATVDVSFGDGSGQCSNADMNALVEMLESARGVG
ncbi:hypothetical protein ATCC90586_011004 [Pythium insidiosum]|nr:hypothetical protein ATCC90586_011004 [Pythium insidiosum]